jgi:hypothetical protein
MPLRSTSDWIAHWRDLLDGEDPHAVTSQLYTATFRHTAFIMLAWAARRAEFRDIPSAFHNVLVSSLVFGGYWPSRVCDPAPC